MRAILNAILAFIGESSLTDEEYGALDVDAITSDRDKFDALKGVLSSREAVSDTYRRLVSYFKAKGMTFGDDAVPSTDVGKSNIFFGSEL